MRLIYTLKNGKTLMSPALTDKEIEDAIDTVGGFMQTSDKINGYLWDKKNLINMGDIAAVTMEEWVSNDA